MAADSLHNWFGYFDLGKIVSVTASAMFGSGLLYQKLDDKDDIAALQELFQELSQKGAEFMNNRLCANKEILIGCRTQNRMNDWLQTHKPDAVRDVEFWKNKLFDHRRKLQAIIEKLPQK